MPFLAIMGYSSASQPQICMHSATSCKDLHTARLQSTGTFGCSLLLGIKHSAIPTAERQPRRSGCQWIAHFERGAGCAIFCCTPAALPAIFHGKAVFACGILFSP